MRTPLLLVIPKNQFNEKELFPVRDGLQQAGWETLVLSRTGQEATAMDRSKFQPDGVLVDWDKQKGYSGKYSAVIVLGGKGAPKSLWNDEILPQILTDHFRAGKIIGAMGLGVGVLAIAALLQGEASAPDDPALLGKLEESAVDRSPDPVTRQDRIITASDGEAAGEFVDQLIAALG